MKLKLYSSLVIRLGILALTCSAWAGTALAEENALKLKQELGLSDQQAGNVDEIFKQARNDQTCAKAKEGKDKKQCWKTKKQGMNKDLESVLNADQMAKLKKMHKKQNFKKAKNKQTKHVGLR